jgi:hypothetical protein
MLRGERLSDYVTPGGEPRGVCVLCKPQAEAAGWLPRSLAGTRAQQPPRQSMARALRERLARVAESARSRPVEAPERPAEGAPRRRRRLLVARPEPDGAGEARRPKASPKRAAHRRRVAEPAIASVRAEDPRRRVRRAVDRFNTSDARRKVAGLIRSLGEPQASVRAGGRGKPTTVTVAWELSWYQWEIDPGEHGEVREIGKGKEIGELSEGARRWNARIDDDGSLRLQSP